MDSATNRRRSPRVRPKQLATRIRSGDDLHIGLGIENISMGGTFVRCNTPMKVGRAVTLEVMRAGASQPLEIEGKITSSVSLAQAAASHRAAGMGIKFDPLPPHVEQRLEGLIVSIDPSAMKLPPSKRMVKAPPLQERTELTPSHVPNSFIGSKTFVPVRRTPEVAELQRELDERNQRIEELQIDNERLTAENKKLQRRLLNLVNNG